MSTNFEDTEERKNKRKVILTKPYEELTEEEKEYAVKIVERRRGGSGAMR